MVQNEYDVGIKFTADASGVVKATEAVESEVQKLANDVQAADSKMAAANKYESSLQSTVAKTRASGMALNEAQTRQLVTQKAMTTNLGSYNASLGSTYKSLSQQTNATNELSGAMKTLRYTMGFVGGMFAWSFASEMYSEIQATLEAKSEMQSYFRVMGMSKTQVQSFNSSLDQTCTQFARMNKYQLGETIASLGVEFKLSNQEMKETMKVVPMIVNEYLRAGRTVQEADLAVKDIAQGQFQRLSRETGVGKEDLIAAGWSGKNTDIQSLMKALETVGKARHWDQFAEKATSLSDVLLITKNRVSEFSAELLDVFTPAVTTGFNGLIGAVTGLRSSWQNLPDIGKVAIGVPALSGGMLVLADVINAKVIPAFTGFAKGRIASLMGLDANIAKTQGFAKALATQVAAQDIATQSQIAANFVDEERFAAITADMSATERLSVVQAESAIKEELLTAAKESGVVAANSETIADMARAQALQVATIAEENNLTTEQALNVWKKMNRIEDMTSTQVLATKILRLNAETVSTEGTTVALIEKTTAMSALTRAYSAEEIASMGAAKKAALFSASMLTAPEIMGVVIAIAALTAGLMYFTSEAQKSGQKWGELKDYVTNGKQKVSDLNNQTKYYNNTLDNLR